MTALPACRALAVCAILGSGVAGVGCAYIWGLSTAAGGIAQGLAGASGSGSSLSGHKIMVFGGPNHRTYLGCLSCNQYDTQSVFNSHGTFGSAYSTESIFNRYGDYGSPYSSYSACSAYASDPPVIVDEQGRYYGRLTVGARSDGPPTAELRAWLAAVCQH